jgi:hypothetical protein
MGEEALAMAALTAGLIGGGLLLGAGANYLSNRSQGKAAERAGKEQLRLSELAAGRQLAAGQQGRKFVEDAGTQGRQDLSMGYRNAGKHIQQGYGSGQSIMRDYSGRALSSLNAGYDQANGILAGQRNRMDELYNGGLGKGFTQDPGYQYQLSQGEQAINRGAAAHGGRMSGRTLQALQGHSQGLASQGYGDFVNRQIGMAQGADANESSSLGRLAGLATGRGSDLARTYMGTGGSLSEMSIASGNALGGMDMSQGRDLSTLGMNTATGMADLGMRAAGGAAGTTTQSLPAVAAGVPYAGAGWGAAGQAFGSLASLGMMYGSGGFGGSGGGGGSMPARGAAPGGGYYV